MLKSYYVKTIYNSEGKITDKITASGKIATLEEVQNADIKFTDCPIMVKEGFYLWDGTEYKKIQSIRKFLYKMTKKDLRDFVERLGNGEQYRCNAGSPYNTGIIVYEGEWVFRNGKVGGTFTPNLEFVEDVLYSYKEKIIKEYIDPKEAFLRRNKICS